MQCQALCTNMFYSISVHLVTFQMQKVVHSFFLYYNNILIDMNKRGWSTKIGYNVHQMQQMTCNLILCTFQTCTYVKYQCGCTKYYVCCWEAPCSCPEHPNSKKECCCCCTIMQPSTSKHTYFLATFYNLNFYSTKIHTTKTCYICTLDIYYGICRFILLCK